MGASRVPVLPGNPEGPALYGSPNLFVSRVWACQTPDFTRTNELDRDFPQATWCSADADRTTAELCFGFKRYNQAKLLQDEGFVMCTTALDFLRKKRACTWKISGCFRWLG
jgi:hypothetical protein